MYALLVNQHKKSYSAPTQNCKNNQTLTEHLKNNKIQWFETFFGTKVDGFRNTRSLSKKLSTCGLINAFFFYYSTVPTARKILGLGRFDEMIEIDIECLNNIWTTLALSYFLYEQIFSTQLRRLYVIFYFQFLVSVKLTPTFL